MKVARRVLFARAARIDLQRLGAFLASESRGRAERAIARIKRGIENLQDFPELGVVVEEGFRHHFLRYGKSGYVVRYRIVGDDIVITRIWHGKEDRPR